MPPALAGGILVLTETATREETKMKLQATNGTVHSAYVDGLSRVARCSVRSRTHGMVETDSEVTCKTCAKKI